MDEQTPASSGHPLELRAPFYEQLFDSVSEGIVFTDQEHHVIRVNREFLRMFGYREVDVMCTNLDEFLVPPGLVTEAETISGLARDGECVSVETVRCKKDGTPVHVSLIASPIKSGTEVVGHYAIYRDISRHMSTRRELDIEKSYLDQLFDGAGEAIALVDSAGHLIRMNTEFTRLFGYTFGDMEERSVHGCIIPPDFSEEEAEITMDLAKGLTVRMETTRLNKDGNSINVSLTAIPVRSDAGNEGAFLIYRDISQRRKTLASLQEKTRFLSTLMKNLPGMVYRCEGHDHRKMEFMTEDGGAFIGKTPSELSGEGDSSFYDLIRAEDREMIEDTVKRAIDQNRPFHAVYRISTASGEERWVLDQGRGVRGTDGELLFIEGFLTDITSAKRSEEALLDSRNRIAMLHEISGVLQTCVTCERIYDLTIETAGRLLEFDACTLSIYEAEKPVLKASLLPEGSDLNVAGSINPVIAEMTFANKETILFETDQAIDESTGDEMRSGICAAIGEFGIFQAISRKKHAFPDSDLRLLELLLGYSTLAIRRLRLQADLRIQATHDPLTGVFNRNYFDHIMEIEAHRAERYERPIGFLMIDIDRVKEVNATLRHLVGDKVLMCVSRIIETSLRKTDIVVRYGGDEFLIILTETGEGTMKAIERLKIGVFSNEELASIAGHPVTISVGSAFWEPGSGCSIDETLRIADRQMYIDKARESPE